jgi:putative ubiquitin-RnfH superfamily antitoxin RatB of RatAB toxin-antitoxin module
MSMRVEVVYALARTQERVCLELPPGSSAFDAVQASGLLQRLPQAAPLHLGVWGRPVSPETRLRDRDRVEIYRPLIADPKQVRRERAATRRH